MNLLEVYIDKIISEEELKDNKIKVEAIYNCYGAKEKETRVYDKTEWDKIKQQGYYLG